MSSVLIWDLPVRLFHWLLAAGFLVAAGIALVLGEHSALFPCHGILGLVLGAMVLLRVVWGIVGTRHARVSTFAFRPGEVIVYLKDLFRGGGREYTGHNPGSAYGIFAMLGLIAALVATGVMLGLGIDGAKEIHEACAYAMLGAVGLHVLGVAFHTLWHRENIVLGMIHGRKRGDGASAIPSQRAFAGVVFLVLVAAWGAGLYRNFDAVRGSTTLPLLGTQLQLVEAGGAEGGGSNEHDGEEDD